MNPIQVLNMSFDIWSALFDLILIIGVFISRTHGQPQARALTGALLANFVVNVSEAFAYAFRGDTSQLGWWVVRAANYGVFLGNHLLLYCACIFIVRTIEKHGEDVNDAFERMLKVTIVLGIALLSLSQIFGFYYSFDEQNRYYRTAGYPVMLLLHFAVLASLLALTIAKRKHLSVGERNSLILFETLPAIAIVAQAFTYGISLTSFASTIALSVLFLVYQFECSREEVEHERTMLDQVIAALSRAVDAKDTYTHGHSGRVAAYAQMIAVRLGLSAPEVERIYRMAMLHDVDKIGIPDSVLNKPGKLTEEEYALIKSHAAHGGDILKEVETMPELVVGARWHHERYDGKGYPDGISGEQIPLEARIICMADCYDAMTSDRVYREHLPQDAVRKEIEKGAGTQFDPELARIMLQIIDEDTDYRLHE